MAELAADDPQWIGGYRLLGKLGSGGMGRVYLARSEGGRTVAVKHVKAELAAEPEFRTRFRLEVEAARRVGGRWTAPVLDADTEADTPWVATGYIAGISLDQAVSGGPDGPRPLPEHSVHALAHGLGSSLAEIHGAGLIHRDLKPSNVLVTIDGPRVIDFGIARALDAVPESTLTHTGVVMGSPSYMPPEQVRGERLTPASDVFCMGEVLAYAATGCPPFGSSGTIGIHAVMYRIAQGEPDLEGLSEPLRSLLAGCLAKKPEDRLSPQDVAAATQPPTTGTASPPWLPAELIAELGRNAVQLLDTDTPPSGCGSRTGSGGTPVSPVPSTFSESLTTAVPVQGRATSPDASTDPSTTGDGDSDDGDSTGDGRQDGTGSRRRPHRPWIAALAAVVVAGIAFAASGAHIPGLGDPQDEEEQPAESSDVPHDYVGTWSGAVERDGEPTGQYRRFVLTEGTVGEVVANSVSLGTNYECKSDGKLVSAGKSLRLDTKVVNSVPDGRCSALGSHTLSAGSGDTLTWEAAGRSATLHRVTGAERIPEEYRGTWQRQLASGGTQELTVRPDAEAGSRRGIGMVSDGGGEHCEAAVDLFSAGGAAGQPVRIAPPDVDEDTASGSCATGEASTLRVQGDSLIREFPHTGQALTYTRTSG